jgi:hypothetical protein
MIFRMKAHADDIEESAAEVGEVGETWVGSSREMDSDNFWVWNQKGNE